MRPVIVTLLVAGSIGSAVLGAAWLIESTVLPTPARADRIAAAATAWLSRYRLVESSFTIGDGRSVRATCLQGWFPTDEGTLEPGTVLRFGRSRIAELDGHTTFEPASRSLDPSQLTVVQLALAGCPRVLARRITADLQAGHDLRVSRAVIAGQPLLELPIPARRLGLQVYLAPSTYRPVAVSARDGTVTGESRIRLTRLTPQLLQAAGLAR